MYILCHYILCRSFLFLVKIQMFMISTSAIDFKNRGLQQNQHYSWLVYSLLLLDISLYCVAV